MRAQKNRNKKVPKVGTKIFLKKIFFDQKSTENLIFGHFGSKNVKDKNFWSKIFLVEIDSEWSNTYFETKISISKILSHYDLT